MKRPTLIGALIIAGVIAVVVFRRRETSDSSSMEHARVAEVSTGAGSSGIREKNSQSSALPRVEPQSPVPELGDVAHKQFGRETTINSAGEELAQNIKNQAGAKKEVNGTATSSSGPGSQDPQLVSRIAGVEKRYKRFFETAGLTEGQENAVVAILEQEASARAAMFREGSQNGKLSLEEQLQRRQQINSNTEQSLAAALPDDKATALASYRASLPQRQLAENAAILGNSVGTSFSPQDIDRITDILHREGVVYFGNAASVSADQYSIFTKSDDKALATAANVLTPMQLTVLRKGLAGRLRVEH